MAVAPSNTAKTPVFLNLWPLPPPASEIQGAQTDGVFRQPKLRPVNPADLRLLLGFPEDRPSGRRGAGRGKPQPADVHQALSHRPLADSGDSRGSPMLRSGPITLSTIALVKH